MPNAAATFDDDFGYDAPARKVARKTRPAAPIKKKRKTKRRFSFDMHKVARYAAVGMSATLALGIMVNALMMQKGHHPAPLFGKTLVLNTPPAQPPIARTTAPAPVADPAPSVTPPPVAPMPKPRHAALDDASDGDAIGKLLQGSAPVPAGDKTDAKDKTDTKTVMGVQRALAKLGFSLKPNGTFGPATRKAIESFEKDRHLPVKGELTHRLVKIISAESGVKID